MPYSNVVHNIDSSPIQVGVSVVERRDVGVLLIVDVSFPRRGRTADR